ncbi:hypothetical protein BHM03_00061709, partial [Ensete ventricosum]
MKSDHDLDTAVTEVSLAVIREWYSIPVEYGLHVPQPGQRPYSLDDPGMCILVDALEAISGAPSNNKGWKSRYLFVSGPVWGFRLDWSAHPIGNASLYLSEEETVLVGRLKGILSSSRAIKEMTELWLVEVGLSPDSRGTIILLYFSLSTCSLTCRSGCRSDGSRGATRDAQGDQRQSPSDPPHCPKASLKRLVVKPIDQHFQMALFDRVHDTGRLITFMDYRIKQLQEELDALKSNGGPEAVTKAEEHAS